MWLLVQVVAVARMLRPEIESVLAVLTLVQFRDAAAGSDPLLFDRPPPARAVIFCSAALLSEAVNALSVPAEDCCLFGLAQCDSECLVGAERCQIVGG